MENKTYKIGEFFSLTHTYSSYIRTAMLAQTNPYLVSLICLTTGNRILNPVEVANPDAITEEEMQHIAGEWKYKLIDKYQVINNFKLNKI